MGIYNRIQSSRHFFYWGGGHSTKTYYVPSSSSDNGHRRCGPKAYEVNRRDNKTNSGRWAQNGIALELGSILDVED